MTREMVYVVSLDEVSRVRLRCRKCEFVESLPVGSALRTFNGQCRNCGQPWLAFDTPAENTVKQFLRAIHEIPKLSPDALGCVVELEVAPTPSE
jgi:hypothetical protein